MQSSIIVAITHGGAGCLVMAFFRHLFLLLLATVSLTCYGVEPLQVGSKAPDWILTSQEGKHVSFYDDCRNYTAIVLFWATWCPYCNALMPELEKLRRQMGGEPVKFYALNIWEDGDPVQHMKKRNYGFTLFLNADNVAKRYGVKGTPGLFMIGPDKTIVYVRNKGATPQEVTKKIRQVLSKTGRPAMLGREI